MASCHNAGCSPERPARNLPRIRLTAPADTRYDGVVLAFFASPRDRYDTSTVAGLRSSPLIRPFMPADRKMVAIASAMACSMVPE